MFSLLNYGFYWFASPFHQPFTHGPNELAGLKGSSPAAENPRQTSHFLYPPVDFPKTKRVCLKCPLKIHTHTYIYIHTHISLYTYVYIYVCVCNLQLTPYDHHFFSIFPWHPHERSPCFQRLFCLVGGSRHGELPAIKWVLPSIAFKYI